MESQIPPSVASPSTNSALYSQENLAGCSRRHVHTPSVCLPESGFVFEKGRTERRVYFDVSACAAPAEPALDAQRGRAGFTGPSEQRGKTEKYSKTL